MTGRRDSAKAAAALEIPNPPIASALKRDQQQHLPDADRRSAGVPPAASPRSDARQPPLAKRRWNALPAACGSAVGRDQDPVAGGRQAAGLDQPRRRQSRFVDHRRRREREARSRRNLPDDRADPELARPDSHAGRPARRRAVRPARVPSATSAPLGRVPPGARSTLPASGHAASTPLNSARTVRSPGPTTIARNETVRDDRPSCTIAAFSSLVASRWATLSIRSPPSRLRPLSAIDEPMAELRLVTAAIPATAMARHSNSRPSPPIPPRRSRPASRSASLTQSARRPCESPAPRARRSPGRG